MLGLLFKKVKVKKRQAISLYFDLMVEAVPKINCVMIFAVSFHGVAQQMEDDIIDWEYNNKLRVQDFEGNLDVDALGDAKTSYKIEIYPRNVLVDENDNIKNYRSLTVKAQFYKKASWFKQAVDSEDLLVHEQLHFDTAELYTRKIRKQFEYLKKKGETRFEIYYGVYKNTWQACREYQKTYDDAITHGFDKAANEKWVLKVISQLKELDAYKS